MSFLVIGRDPTLGPYPTNFELLWAHFRDKNVDTVGGESGGPETDAAAKK